MKIKTFLVFLVMMAFCHCGAQNAQPTKFTIGEGKTAKIYELQKVDDARGYLKNYADNFQHDKDFKAHEDTALKTIHTTEGFYGTWWSILPPLLAIVIALITKEIYSSLFLGIVMGGLLHSGFSFEGTLVTVIQKGFIESIADVDNVGILFFLVLLGTMVAMMNKTGASAAFGNWALTNIKSRIGAQLATILLGILIFVDDYFNCLTVGSVMRPVTDAKKVSRAKLAYLIDATAAPICILAPISSWAAAIAGFAKDDSSSNGFAMFLCSIPYNFYAILTILAMCFFAMFKFDFGSMRAEEEKCFNSTPECINEATERTPLKGRGSVIDLVLPVCVLIGCCVIGMIYTGGYFGDSNISFVQASAGAQCNHITHVRTQLPYAMVVAGVSVAAYLIAPFVQNAWLMLPIAIGLLLITLLEIMKICKPKPL